MTPSPWRRPRWSRVLRPGLLVPLALLVACAGGGPGSEESQGSERPDDADGDADTRAVEEAAPGSVRFALVVEAAPHDPVWIQANTDSDPVGWVTLRGPDGRVVLEEMCAVEDCGEPPVVCGAALPMVRRIAERDGPGAAEYRWEGRTSVVDREEECERRVVAPPGAYTARICWGSTVAADDTTGASRGVMGHVESPTCVERDFTHGVDDEVVVRIPGAG